MAEWHDNDQFWARCQPFIFGERVRAGTSQEVDDIVRLLGVQTPARILDLPCGIGRHSLELARRGFQVTGVDRTRAYLDQARGAAILEGCAPRTQWVQADMRDAVDSGGFDAAINVYTSFGYFESPEDDSRVARNLFASLRPGGRVLLEMVNKGWITRRFQASDWHEEPGGVLVLEQRSLSSDGTWIENRWLIARGEERSEIKFGHRLYGVDELGTLLREAGFDSLQAFGGLSGIEATPESPRLVMVATRPR